MALITCPECGREISDKAVACPGCGCPVELHEDDTRTDMEKLVDEIYEKYAKEKVKAVKELQKATGMNLKPAKDIMDKKFQGLNATSTIKKSVARQEKIDRNEEKFKKNVNGLVESLNTLADLCNKDKTSRCPKCRSTQITYGGNRPSIGRALVGGVVAGGAGAAIGGLTGKKGYAVCLNCGKRWKI